MLPAACATLHLPEVDDALIHAAVRHGASVPQLRRGHQLMTEACVACHGPIHPRELTATEWSEVLPRMIEKSRLQAADRAAIEAYVQAVGAADQP